MKVQFSLILAAIMTIFSSCIEHEVIPPPKVTVELSCSFRALINGENYSIAGGTGTHTCLSTKAKELFPLPQPSTATYIATINSPEVFDYIQIMIGKVLFNADLNTDPTIDQFRDFFTLNQSPAFKTNGDGGVQIVHRDDLGRIWYSRENDINFKSFIFTDLRYEDDDEAEYMKFTANFTCYLFNDIAVPTDSILVENGEYKGYFQR